MRSPGRLIRCSEVPMCALLVVDNLIDDELDLSFPILH